MFDALVLCLIIGVTLPLFPDLLGFSDLKINFLILVVKSSHLGALWPPLANLISLLFELELLLLSVCLVLSFDRPLDFLGPCALLSSP